MMDLVVEYTEIRAGVDPDSELGHIEHHIVGEVDMRGICDLKANSHTVMNGTFVDYIRLVIFSDLIQESYSTLLSVPLRASNKLNMVELDMPLFQRFFFEGSVSG